MFQALFAKVVPYQCLGCVWSQRDKKENMSPTIRATIAQFNAVTNQVIGSLLCQPTDGSPTSSPLAPTSPAQRARIIEKWIKVAQVSWNGVVVLQLLGVWMLILVLSHNTRSTNGLFLNDVHPLSTSLFYRSVVAWRTSLLSRRSCRHCSPMPFTGWGRPGRLSAGMVG